MLKRATLTAAALVSALTLTEYIGTVNMMAAQVIYTFILIAMVGVSSVIRAYPGEFFEETDSDTFSKFLLALAIVPIVRIAGYSLPGIYFGQMENFFLYSLPMIAAAIFLIYLHGDFYNPQSIGITSNRLKLQVLVALGGIPIGLVEYLILRPDPMVSSLALGEIISPVAILFFSTGFAEELVFRGIIQRGSVEALDKNAGIVLTAFLFAALHLGHSYLDAAYIMPIALFWGYFVYRTRSILGVVFAHGIANAVLFIVGPLFL